jgi:PPM family protein phosphatase
MRLYGLSDIGRVRNINQDAFLIESKDDYNLIVVCDGMGGANAGEVASALAISSIRASFLNDRPRGQDAQALTLWLESAINRANHDILTQAQLPKYHGMGTTIAACLISDEAIVGANVGDSRIYVIKHDQAIQQISEDHSLIHEMIKQGHITEAQAKYHPQRAVLTQVLGVTKNIHIDIFVIQRDVQYVWVCSDGVHNMLDDQSLLKIFVKRSKLQTKVQAVIDAANHAGGLDNLTLVVAAQERAR